MNITLNAAALAFLDEACACPLCEVIFAMAFLPFWLGKVYSNYEAYSEPFLSLNWSLTAMVFLND